jgi:hypothetical protein
MPFKLVLDGTQDEKPYANIDDAMLDVFIKHENAYFGPWTDSNGVDWPFLDVFEGTTNIGRIIAENEPNVSDL